jgi:restriction system protein
MRLRTAKQGSNAGSQFWGCSGYPECKSTKKYDPNASDNRTDPTDPADMSDMTD